MVKLHHAFIPTAIIVLVLAFILNVHVAIISALSCAGMVGCDFFATLMNVSENRGEDLRAGYGDMGSDFFGKYLLAGWSGSTLTHGYGALGWIAIWPVLVTGFHTTGFTTRWLRRSQQREVEK